jgi:hypothetical protein
LGEDSSCFEIERILKGVEWNFLEDEDEDKDERMVRWLLWKRFVLGDNYDLFPKQTEIKLTVWIEEVFRRKAAVEMSSDLLKSLKLKDIHENHESKYQ